MPNEKRIISKSKLDAIAGAIREKTGSDSTYTPDQMATAIGAIETQGDYQEKTFTENGTYTPDAGYDAFSQVAVNVQSSGSNPLQDMLDRSSDINGKCLFSAFINGEYNIFSQLTNEDLIKLDFSNKHYTRTNNMFDHCTNLTTIPQLDFSSVTHMSDMFRECASLTTIPQLDFSSVLYASGTFYLCSSLTTVSQLNLSNVINTSNMLANCGNLTTVLQMNLSSVTTSDSMFEYSSHINTLDFSNIKTIGAHFAYNVSSLSVLIIRNQTTLAVLKNTNAFTNTPIASGTGYIYVPDDLVDSYKQATNWSTFAAQIKPLSELPQGE